MEGRAGSAFRAALLALSLLIPAPTDGPGEGLDDLETKLRSPDKWTRTEAVEELARRRSPAAWALVIQALADPKGEVADTAQLVLAALDDEKTLERLAKREGLGAKEPLVRARVAELLGRSRLDPPAKLLIEALSDSDPEVRRMGAWSIERLGAAGRLGDEAREKLAAELARRARSERDALARGRELFAWTALDRGGARAGVEAAQREREPLVRGAAAALLPRVLEVGAAVEALASLAADPVASVRTVAAESLGEIGTRSAAAVLVQRLAEEQEERLLLRHVERLQALSGLKHRRDVRPWNDWLRALPEDWRGRSTVAADAPGPGENGSVTLDGLPILSRRVAILIDLSGSIWNIRPDGRTRKEIVDGKLREALESFTPDTRFNLIPYTGKPFPWKEELVRATPANVRAAAGWFEDLHETGSGNFWDAALLALADPEVDTLVVLFDGEPTGGIRHRFELIVPLFLERNAARRVTVDILLVDASKHLQRIWGELAAGTGGRLVAVQL